jgi:4-hydroxybenzoate polyprenyltransferase
VAEHLGVFDAVIATDAERNLSAHAKRDALVRKFGHRGFDYVGNSRDDLPVWAAARKAYVVNAAAAVERRARAGGNVAAVIDTRAAGPGTWIGAIRLHQWLKNLLLFVPLLAAHRYAELSLVFDALLAFLCFGLCASSAYVLNDLLDLHEDRRHSRKRARAFAAGKLSVQSGLVACAVLVASGMTLAAACLPAVFTIGVAAYYGLTLVYSLWFKQYMVVDVMTLATLYTLRIVVGGAALDIPLSFWLLAFSMFMFLSLALVKRYAELHDVHSQGREAQLYGRDYVGDDRPIVGALGASAGYMAVMVLALYINDSRTAQLYRDHELIWLACPLLLTWVSRVWMFAHRGWMHEDPFVTGRACSSAP